MKYYNMQEKLPYIMGNVVSVSDIGNVNNINGIGKYTKRVMKYKITGSGLSSYLSVPISHLRGGDKIKIHIEFEGDSLECSLDRHHWTQENQQFIGEYRVPLSNNKKVYDFSFIVQRYSNVRLHEFKLGHFTNKIGVTTINELVIEVESEIGHISELLRFCNNEKPVAVCTITNTSIPNNVWTTLDNGVMLEENFYLIDRDRKSFVAPSDGYYFVSAQATFESVPPNKRFAITVVKNRDGLTHKFPNGNVHSATSHYLTVHVSGIIKLERGNLLNIAVKQESGVNVNCLQDFGNTSLTVMQL